MAGRAGTPRSPVLTCFYCRWSCRCKPGWQGELCDTYTGETHDCGHGTWVETKCRCDASAIHDPEGYCVLDCRNGGTYDYADDACICEWPFYGPTCEQKEPSPTPPPSSSSSSTGEEEPATDLYSASESPSSTAPYIFFATALAVIALVIVVVRRVRGVESTPSSAQSHELRNLITTA
jgi:hypothetical protein